MRDYSDIGRGKVLPEVCSIGGWWTCEARYGSGACEQGKMLLLAFGFPQVKGPVLVFTFFS